MSSLVLAEWRKLASVRSWIGVLLGTIVFVTLATLATVGVLASPASSVPLQSAAGAETVAGAAASAGFLASIWAVLLSAGEYRHGTITPTLLVEPRRARVLLAKAAIVTLASALVGLVAAASAIVVGQVAASGHGVDLVRHAGTLAATSGSETGATVLFGLIGLGLAMALANQVLAIVVVLGWFLLAESLLAAYAPSIAKWLPGEALSAISGRDPAIGSGSHLLSAPLGSLVALGWTAAVLGAGALAFLRLRRDVTGGEG
jgi:ABC-2 type transport system permease protein